MDRSAALRPARPVRGFTPALRRDPVLIGLGLVIVGSVAGFGIGLGPLVTQVTAAWVLMACLHVGLAISAGGVSRTPGVTNATRRVWAAVSLAGVAYAVGDAVQLVKIAIHPRDLQVALGGTVQSLSVLVGTVVLVAAMLTSPIGLDSRRDRTHFWLDVGIVMAAATTFGAYAYVPGPGSTPLLSASNMRTISLTSPRRVLRKTLYRLKAAFWCEGATA